MQNDLISRSALLRKLIDSGWLKCDTTDSAEMIAVQSSIDDAPAVDAVEVVRCKDCRYGRWEQDQCHGRVLWYCANPNGLTVNRKDGFCSYGERRADDGK